MGRWLIEFGLLLIVITGLIYVIKTLFFSRKEKRDGKKIHKNL